MSQVHSCHKRAPQLFSAGICVTAHAWPAAAPVPRPRFGRDVKIVHFLGSNKPWMSPHAADASSPAGRFHAAWWGLYQSRVRRADGGHHFLVRWSAGGRGRRAGRGGCTWRAEEE